MPDNVLEAKFILNQSLTVDGSPAWGWTTALTTLHRTKKKKLTYFETLRGAWWENLKERDKLEDLGINVTILELILDK